MVTLKKRLTFLRAAMKYAAGRRIITRDEVLPELKIKDDGKRGKRVLQMNEFLQLRLALCGGFRRFAEVGQLTGFHTVSAARPPSGESSWLTASWLGGIEGSISSTATALAGQAGS